MTLSQFTQPTFGIRFEGNHLAWPTELGVEPKNWKDVVFLSYDQFPFLESPKWNEIVVTEAGELYLELHDLSLVESKENPIGYKADSTNISLRKLEEFTGQISFEGFIPNDLEIEDYYFICSFIVIEGKFKSLEVHNKQKINNSDRKENSKKIQLEIKSMIKRQDAFWFLWIYRPFKYILRGSFEILVLIWNLPLWLLDKGIRFLTPI